MSNSPIVFVVDDDAGMRKSTGMLLKAANLSFQAFESAKDFLNAYDPAQAGCIILDVRMPEMSGLDLQEILLARGVSLPIIMVSGHASVRDAVKAMKLGSFDFMEKPYAPEALLEKIKLALASDCRIRLIAREISPYRERFQYLTERERQILSLVVLGKPSKFIADEIGVSVSTVDNHRANIMKKLNVGTSAELVRVALLMEPSQALRVGSIA